MNDENKGNQRNKRETYHIDYVDIQDNVKALRKPQEDKDRIFQFATKLNDLLKENEISQKEIVGDLEISDGTLSNYRNGKREPTLSVLAKLAKKLNVSIDYLLGISDCPTYTFDDINKKIGLSQKAIAQLYKFQHDYFPFEDDIDITEDKKISDVYRKNFNILNLLIENSVDLFFILESIQKLKDYYGEYSKREEQRSKDNETNEFVSVETLEEKRELNSRIFNVQQEFLEFIKKAIKEEDRK